MTKSEFLERVAANKMHLSYSSILALMKSPKHFLKYHTEKKEPTPSMIFGSLVHALVLQPDNVPNMFAIKPQNANKASNANKETLAQFEAQQAGRMAVSESDFIQAQQIANAIYEDETCNALLLGECEKRFEYERSGVLLKGVYDIYHEFAGITDLKYTADAKPAKFAKKAMYEFYYYLQAAIYSVENSTSYTILAVDSDCYTSTIVFGEDIIQSGFRLLDKWIMQYKKLQERTEKEPQIWDCGYSFYYPNGYIIE
jgi:hypothetical protein